MKYYALKDENNKIILESWDEAKEVLKTLKSPKYKSFKTKEEAKAFLEGKEIEVDYSIPTAYIDGSYDSKTENYSFGGCLFIDGKILKFKKKYLKDEYSSFRNVAGEIKGAGYIINYAINHGIKNLNIYYDYLGIEKWYKGEWKAKTPIAIEYVNYANEAKKKINVNFFKIESHTNNKYNDLADELAKEALK